MLKFDFLIKNPKLCIYSPNFNTQQIRFVTTKGEMMLTQQNIQRNLQRLSDDTHVYEITLAKQNRSDTKQTANTTTTTTPKRRHQSDDTKATTPKWQQRQSDDNTKELMTPVTYTNDEKVI
ncbi:hypothetical protein C2G38_2154912 [Gigaspora rosea]|uniref:Uncharacterized protein n=1 Tax=Gigaspora rosea TaxID=44941 RepID=A0A397W7V9_9GLOM|nr:hypothetical protein C2G38_2154912 [Gigaspora rosea]